MRSAGVRWGRTIDLSQIVPTDAEHSSLGAQPTGLGAFRLHDLAPGTSSTAAQLASKDGPEKALRPGCFAVASGWALAVPIVEITYRCETDGSRERPRPLSSDAACRRLDNGNRTFATLLSSWAEGNGAVRHFVPVDPRDLGLASGEANAPAQLPFAAILGCSDARVPVELIFGEGPNDLFVIRVAGNVLGAEVLGSLKYAVEHLGGSMKVIAVLGHSGCGAVAAAVDVFLSPGTYLPLAINHSLRSIVDRLLVVVQACANKLMEVFGPEIASSPGYRKALTEAAIVINAALTAHSIQREFGAGSLVDLQTVYGVYLLETREVWTPPLSKAEGAGLAPAPHDPGEFLELGDAVAKSDRIASFIRPHMARK